MSIPTWISLPSAAREDGSPAASFDAVDGDVLESMATPTEAEWGVLEGFALWEKDIILNTMPRDAGTKVYGSSPEADDMWFFWGRHNTRVRVRTLDFCRQLRACIRAVSGVSHGEPVRVRLTQMESPDTHLYSIEVRECAAFREARAAFVESLKTLPKGTVIVTKLAEPYYDVLLPDSRHAYRRLHAYDFHAEREVATPISP